jgi:hypothetical protein
MTIGTGYFGRSSVSENVGPQHLLQWVKIAYNKRDDVPFGDFSATAQSAPETRPRIPEGEIDYSFNWVGGRPSPIADTRGQEAGDASDSLREEIRQIILEELRDLQQDRR